MRAEILSALREPVLDPPENPKRPATPLANDVSTVPELFLKRVRRDGHRIALRQKHKGRWQVTSWMQFGRQAGSVATWLINQGISRQDKICIIGSTRPQWCITDMGGQLAGCVTFGAYPTLTADQLAYVLEHADTKVVFVEGTSELEKLREIRSKVPTLEHVVCWSHTDEQDVVPWQSVLDTEPDEISMLRRVGAIEPDDTAIIVYTSGTTGPPKGAMITHRNILSVLGAAGIAPFEEDDVSFNFLPMAHVAERVLGFYGRLNSGVTTYFASEISKVLEEIQEAKPTIFGSVPRIFEKAYAKIMAQVDQANPRRQRIFRWAESVGRDCVRRWQRGEDLPPHLEAQYRLADRLVFARIREVFGGRVRYFVTGAAPIALEILEFFWAAGFRIYEVYGMTEATVITHANRPGLVRLGSVGQVLPYAEHKIAQDGEILVRGPAVFKGYYKNEEATKASVIDGWLHTGDIGEIDKDGYLYIRDRKKHIIITAGGKNLTPANIENEVKASDPLISQVHAHGDRRKYLVALVTIGPAEAIEWARSQNLVAAGPAEEMLAALAGDPFARPEGLAELMRSVTAEAALHDRIRGAVRRANSNLSRVETIKRIHILERELSVDEDEMTPTLKIKRRNVEAKFQDIFDRLYEEDDFGVQI